MRAVRDGADLARGDDDPVRDRNVDRGRGAPTARIGENGFGYDPIFWYPPLGRTTGEMTLADKGAVSHRARAFRESGALADGCEALAARMNADRGVSGTRLGPYTILGRLGAGGMDI